jgi:two-component system phosphate regulon response regulator PhoB
MCKQIRVLVADGEPKGAEFLAGLLQREGYETCVAADGASALTLAQKRLPDLLIVAGDMRGVRPHHLIKALNVSPMTAGILVIVLSSISDENEIAETLAVGADDYVVEPVSPKTLMARVAAVLRRRRWRTEESTLVMGSLAVDPAKHELTIAGHAQHLTPTEVKILIALMQAGGRTLSKDELLHRAFTDDLTSRRAVDVHIAALRHKFAKCGWMITIVRGVGFRLLEEKRQVPSIGPAIQAATMERGAQVED